MPDLLANNFKYRKSFAKTLPAVDMDNLISIQRQSYEKLLQVDNSDPLRLKILHFNLGGLHFVY